MRIGCEVSADALVVLQPDQTSGASDNKASNNFFFMSPPCVQDRRAPAPRHPGEAGLHRPRGGATILGCM